MAAQPGISLDHFRVLTERAGLRLTEAELQDLKPMYDHYAALVASLHDAELQLQDGDLAVSFSAAWGATQ